jgi:hypothetical protein
VTYHFLDVVTQTSRGAKLEEHPEPDFPDLPDYVRVVLESPSRKHRGTRRFIFSHGGERLAIGDATWVSRYLLPTQGEREAVLEEIRALSKEFGRVKKSISEEPLHAPENVEVELELAYWRRIRFLDVAANDYLASAPDATVVELEEIMEHYRRDSDEARKLADL